MEHFKDLAQAAHGRLARPREVKGALFFGWIFLANLWSPQILHISDAETMQFGGYDIHIGSETLIIVTLPGME